MEWDCFQGQQLISHYCSLPSGNGFSPTKETWRSLLSHQCLNQLLSQLSQPERGSKHPPFSVVVSCAHCSWLLFQTPHTGLPKSWLCSSWYPVVTRGEIWPSVDRMMCPPFAVLLGFLFQTFQQEFCIRTCIKCVLKMSVLSSLCIWALGGHWTPMVP